MPHCFSREQNPLLLLLPAYTVESSHSQRHPPPPPTPTRHHQNKSYQIASDSKHERYCLLSMYKGSAERGGGGRCWQCTTTLATTKPRPGLRARKTKQPPVHYHTTDPVAAQPTAHISPPGWESGSPLAVVWLWMHLNPR